MTMVERVGLYIERLCESIGVSAANIYHPSTDAWYFSNGGSTIEVFLTTQKNVDGDNDYYLRCMSALCEIPKDIMRQFALYRTVLQVNAKYLGFKIVADEGRGLLCVVSERNISGMDYEEMVGMISYIAHWGTKLEKYIAAEFAG
ncbi:MAG: hypothetical protein EOO09_03960 [Chitinophagaceae bacterium]|nr:MAG: hypothetical protein EOO09_03960 [Chitinophagaceae bacterium]